MTTLFFSTYPRKAPVDGVFMRHGAYSFMTRSIDERRGWLERKHYSCSGNPIRPPCAMPTAGAPAPTSLSVPAELDTCSVLPRLVGFYRRPKPTAV
jgi:hypothetical protein